MCNRNKQRFVSSAVTDIYQPYYSITELNSRSLKPKKFNDKVSKVK